ncbi:hypothetical protein A2482_04710 [Candidatus Falkowbacteria bacterium RIFOXYC2_FULL_48_21]|uniref:Uncharacterized protein n=1 Tax=Candidatus Falkowbacteria bacterium RIFOXYC2_FULL_48_21 TaxID=1798005 RepID=A0A1F5T5H2_9BACT|nr:MAG: hypothetical protein A2482_04710 [Candidatus Falkowbacteria bacterium RIFOXYC2_FULL_48_21]
MKINPLKSEKSARNNLNQERLTSSSIEAKRNTKNQSSEVEKVQKADLLKSEKSARNNLTRQKDFRTDSTEITVGKQ